MKITLLAFLIALVAIGSCTLVPVKFHSVQLDFANCETPNQQEIAILKRFISTGESREVSRRGSNLDVGDVLFDSTVSRDPTWIAARIQGVRDTAKLQDLISHYIELNSRKYAFCPPGWPKSGTILINRSQFDEAFHTRGMSAWSDFYSQYPMAYGVQAFSRVAFSSDSSLAMIYRERHCGGLCGSGSFELFKFVDGEWLHWRSVLAWIS